MGRLNTPTIGEIKKLAAANGLTLDDSDAGAYQRMVSAVLRSCERLDELEPTPSPETYPRELGYRPPRSENPYNAWYCRTEVKGAPSGPLYGKEIGIKNNICVSGAPMLVGETEEPFVPNRDATVVTRLLDAGAVIVGKTTASDGAGISDLSSNSPFVTVRNPHKPTHAPGGSSSGNAAALAAGDIDLAIGSDQGGSVRIPAAWSGIVGLRPTFGLVPYTGVIASEMTAVALGPMSRSVETIASALAAIAGPDSLDPRQQGIVPPPVDYQAALDLGARGLRIAVVEEGFGQKPRPDVGLPGSESIVDDKVRAALGALEARGAIVERVLIPAHTDGFHLFHAMYTEGNAAMILANAVGTNFTGYYDVALMEAYGRAWRNEPDVLSAARRSVLIIAEHLRSRYHGRYYALAQNLRDSIRQAYDRVLTRYDVLAMPTVPFRATPIPRKALPADERVGYAMQMIGNTCQSAVTGHPAISVPCGMTDDLPIGLQFVGSHFAEAVLLRAAAAIEGVGEWKSL